MKETELFPPLKQWLEERGYDVYAEVGSGRAGGRADIVAVAGPAVAVVEMKVSLSLDLIAQAVRWRPYANYVYVAIPGSHKRRTHNYGEMILRREGIGLLEVIEGGRYGTRVYDRTKACFNRRVDDHIRQSLVPQHKELPGGHAGGGYVTTYRLTIDEVKSYLQKKRRVAYGQSMQGQPNTDGWTTIKDILDHCETHYSAPKPSLSKALREFEADWCESKIEGRKLWFRYKEVRA
ncbi:MAG: hypothetical protein J7639_24715 [Paenibacillaceae bacterium]|nr:hypothetical protein [Paenibacillaceae bacterium]